MKTLTLGEYEQQLLREAICARHAVEVWIGDGTLQDPRATTAYEELYRRLGGEFEDMLTSMVEFCRARDELAPVARLGAGAIAIPGGVCSLCGAKWPAGGHHVCGVA